MPREIRTGYAAYCVAAAAAFHDVASKYVEDSKEIAELLKAEGKSDASETGRRAKITPEICCAAELFGYDRFLSDPSSRTRAWQLKDSGSGRENRLTIFQKMWLDSETLKDIDSARKGLDEIEGWGKSITSLHKWLKDQDGFLSTSLRHCGTKVELGRATSALEVSVRAEQEKLRQALEELAEGSAPGHGEMLREACDWMGAQDEMLMALLSTDASIGEQRASLLTLKEDASNYLRKLRTYRARLKKMRDPLSDWLKDPERRATWQKQSIENCVRSIVDGNASILWKALQQMGAREFSRVFSTTVTPAIAESFVTERYSAGRISAFRVKMDSLVNELSGGESKSSVERYERFIKVLVGSLIYGPDAKLPGKGTEWEKKFVPIAEDELDEYIGKQLVISQHLSSDGSLLGNTAIYGPNDVVFLGRSGVVEDYVEKCKSLTLQEALDSFREKRLQAFQIAEAHGQVSNLHGMITYEDDGWVYRDFSRFGTRLVGMGKDDDKLDVSFIGKAHELRAGDTLYLGATQRDSGQRLFYKAAAIRVSLFLDIDTIDYLF